MPLPLTAAEAGHCRAVARNSGEETETGIDEFVFGIFVATIGAR